MLTTSPERTAYRALVADVAARAKAKLPECNGRVDKAVALVLAGDVEAQAGDGSWRVGSCTDPLTTHRVQGTSCSCEDSQYGRAPRGLCKHVLAVMMQMRVQALLPQAPAVEWPPDEELAAESTPEVHTGCTSPLPEAPASVNVRLQVAGREVQWTLRDTDEARLAVRLEALLQRYPVPQASSPASPQGQPLSREQQGAMAGERSLPDWCKVHDCAMHRNHGKDGRSWHSHYVEGEGWCKGR
jgi:hypothetical protein